MPETTDANLAAYLIYKGITFDYRSEGDGRLRRITFTFPGMTDEKFHALKAEFLNSDIQDFVDAQKRVKNVIHNLAV